MEIKEQTRKLAAGCSKHRFEVVDITDEVSSKHIFEVVDETDEVSNILYGNVTLTWFEERFSKSIIFQKAEVSLLRPVSIVLKRLIFYSGSTKILICDLS
ncbi:N-ethylammeline chlorohydrolase [Streptococcus pneumoniae]|nr:N-ethylammeline chlorohydrolase [Streptococcus pneumoniae]